MDLDLFLEQAWLARFSLLSGLQVTLGTSLLYWGMRGFHSESIGGCNTWVVGSEKVR